MIDKDMVQGMAGVGFTQKAIAERLGVSTRQIRRVMGELGIKIHRLKFDSEVEGMMRDLYKRFEPGNQASVNFGISRQALLK